jgi:hypothetical protein
MKEMTNAYKTLVGKLGMKRLLGRCIGGWKDNIKMVIRN